MSQESRGEVLAELAAAINELTEVRHHVEIYEVQEREGTKRRRTRRRHIQTLPSLLDELADAMMPATTGDAVTSGGFESSMSAATQPTSVMGEIVAQSGTWAAALSVRKETLAGRLHALVGVHMTDQQMHNLRADARRWVRLAKLATGWEKEPFTLNSPCPYCWRKHVLTISGDLDKAKCSKCGAEWDESTIGLLGSMLAVNETAETWAAAKCEAIHDTYSCQRSVGHEMEHRDQRGRYWYDPPAQETA